MRRTVPGRAQGVSQFAAGIGKRVLLISLGLGVIVVLVFLLTRAL
jgi:hypothetical protein